MRSILVASFVVVVGCAKPEITGSALPLNMQPSPPQFVGAYDFDLLDRVQGQACITHPALGSDATVYWVNAAGLDKITADSLSAQAIAAAMVDAIKAIPSADSVVVTRVLTEGHGSDKVCATVYGRAVRLKKARGAAEPKPDDTDPAEKPDP